MILSIILLSFLSSLRGKWTNFNSKLSVNGNFRNDIWVPRKPIKNHCQILRLTEFRLKLHEIFLRNSRSSMYYSSSSSKKNICRFWSMKGSEIYYLWINRYLDDKLEILWSVESSFVCRRTLKWFVLICENIGQIVE